MVNRICLWTALGETCILIGYGTAGWWRKLIVGGDLRYAHGVKGNIVMLSIPLQNLVTICPSQTLYVGDLDKKFHDFEQAYCQMLPFIT